MATCVALLSVRIFFGKPFVKTHVDQNRALRQRGIHCVQAQDAEARMEKTQCVTEKRKEE